jgi:hypothetical protein
VQAVKNFHFSSLQAEKRRRGAVQKP